MDNVVYILGAGFSKPWGLPLMTEFVNVARLMHRNDEQKFPNIDHLTSEIRSRLDRVKRNFVDPEDNFEEALTILEMDDFFNSKNGDPTTRNLKSQLVQYISTVIRHSTKEPLFPEKPIRLKTMPHEQINLPTIFGDIPQAEYCTFVALLNGLVIKSGGHMTAMYGNEPFEVPTMTIHQYHQANYSIITLNYDTVLEIFNEFINQLFGFTGMDRLAFQDDGDGIPPQVAKKRIPFVKLHGCVARGEIIPPSYLKVLYRSENLPKSWKTAYELLMKANKVRIIGYSLPETDAYIKYLLKTATTKSDNLDYIDVICRDTNGEARKRYETLIKGSRLNFRPKTTEDYLGFLMQAGNHYEGLKFDYLERAHENFFKW